MSINEEEKDITIQEESAPISPTEDPEKRSSIFSNKYVDLGARFIVGGLGTLLIHELLANHSKQVIRTIRTVSEKHDPDGG